MITFSTGPLINAMLFFGFATFIFLCVIGLSYTFNRIFR